MGPVQETRRHVRVIRARTAFGLGVAIAGLSALARKFADVFGQAAWAAGRSSRWARRSRSLRVNFHSNGVAICS